MYETRQSTVLNKSHVYLTQLTLLALMIVSKLLTNGKLKNPFCQVVIEYFFSESKIHAQLVMRITL